MPTVLQNYMHYREHVKLWNAWNAMNVALASFVQRGLYLLNDTVIPIQIAGDKIPTLITDIQLLLPHNMISVNLQGMAVCIQGIAFFA